MRHSTFRRTAAVLAASAVLAGAAVAAGLPAQAAPPAPRSCADPRVSPSASAQDPSRQVDLVQIHACPRARLHKIQLDGRVAATSAGATDIPALVSSMSLEEKVGQLFVTYAYGESATTTDPAMVAQNQALYGVDNGAELVRKYHLGGVIYFTWANSLTDPAQVAQLSNGMQQAATTSGRGVPLLVSTDQEGGNVVRLGAPLAISPGNMALGATGDPGLAYSMSQATGRQLAALGIDVDDAPVVDTNTNPANMADGPRSFSDEPSVTSDFGAASVRGLESANVAATAKHFPGLGSTAINTDNGVAVTDQTRQDFNHYDLPAFKAAIAAGTDEIMAAHIIAPALDPTGTPASLSRPMVTGLLRHTLHYDGVVITDALSAAALEDYTDAQIAVRAVQAGDDQLLMPTNLAVAQQAVLDAVADGKITESRIDESVTRVLTLKQRLGLFDGAQVSVARAADSVGRPGQLAVMNKAAHRAITVYRNEDHVLPLTATGDEKVLVTGYGLTTGTNLAADIAAKGVQVQRVYTGSAPSDAAITAAVHAAGSVDHVVVISNNAWNDPGQRKLIKRLQRTGTPVVVLAVGAPYELGYLPDTPTFAASYGYQPASMVAAADVLFGRKPTGRSPITIRTPDGSTVVAPIGTGLRY